MKFESIGARVYYLLGAAYYVHHWFFILGVTGLVSSFFFRSQVLPVLGILVISVVMITGGFAAVIAKTKKRLDCVNPDLIITALTDTYQVHSDTEFTFVKNVTIKARHTGVDSYKTKFRWTGRGNIRQTLECGNRECAVHSVSTSDDAWDILRVQFQKPLRKGEEVSFTLRLELLDTSASAKPFSLKFIDDLYPNGLTMRVVLPSTPTRVLKEIFSSARAELSLASDNTAPQRPDTTINWFIRRPRLGRRYRLSWVS